MATNKERLDSIEARLGIVERASGIRPSKREIPWPLVGSATVVVVTIIIAAVSATHIIDNKMSGLDVRLTKTEAAVKVLSSQQSEQIQNLIKSLLATAKAATDPNISAKAMLTAATLTLALKQEKRPSTPEFFQQATEHVRQVRQSKPMLTPAAFKAEQALAEYRSASEPLPQIKPTIECTPESVVRSALGAAPDTTKAARPVEGIVIANCPQILDGFAWKNVIFINSRISYHGAAVILDNVLFVNCTFDFPINLNAERVLEYAALGEKQLSVEARSPSG